MAAAAGTAVAGGIALLFAALWLLGAFDAGEAAAATAVALVLAFAWVVAALERRRRLEPRELAHRERERRGF